MTYPTITPLPTPPSRQDPATFSDRADALLGALPNFVTETNLAGDFIESSAATIAADKEEILTAVDSALSSANFKGEWADLTGALAVPASVSHNSKVWLLLTDLADVTASEPSSDNVDWLLSLSTAPVDGQIYGQKDGDWEVIPSGVTIETITVTSTVSPTGDTRYLCNGAADIVLSIDTSGLAEGSLLIIQNKSLVFDVFVGGQVNTLVGFNNYMYLFFDGLLLRTHNFSPVSSSFLLLGSDSSPQFRMLNRDFDSYTDNVLNIPNVVSVNTQFDNPLAISADGKYIYLSRAGNGYYLWYRSSGNVYTSLTIATNPPASSYVASFSPDGVYMAVGTGTAGSYFIVYKITAATNTFTRILPVQPATTAFVYTISWKPDGNELYIGTGNNLYRYLRSGDTFSQIEISSDPTLSSCYSPDGVYLATITNGNVAKIYKNNSFLVNLSTPPSGSAPEISFSPCGSYVCVTNSHSPYCSIYKRDGDVFTKLTLNVPTPAIAVYSHRWTSDGSRLILGISTNAIKTYKRDGDNFTEVIPQLDISITQNMHALTVWPLAIPGSK